jgi:hypothetical protein
MNDEIRLQPADTSEDHQLDRRAFPKRLWILIAVLAALLG